MFPNNAQGVERIYTFTTRPPSSSTLILAPGAAAQTSKPASWSYPEPARRTRSVAVSLTRTSASGACCARGPPRTLLSWQQPPQSARRSTASLIRSPRTLRSRGGLRAGRRPPFEREERALSLRIRMHVTSQLKNRVGHGARRPTADARNAPAGGPVLSSSRPMKSMIYTRPERKSDRHA